jgi:hypothetical protein
LIFCNCNGDKTMPCERRPFDGRSTEAKPKCDRKLLMWAVSLTRYINPPTHSCQPIRFLSSPTTSTSILVRYLLTYLRGVRPHLKLLIDGVGSTVSRMFLSVIVVDINCSLCPWALGCLRRPRHHPSLLAVTVTDIDSLTSWGPVLCRCISSW